MQDFCFHIHTPRCGHADKNMQDEVIAKLFYEAGFKTIAFTDHNPWKTFLENYPNHSMAWSEKQEYLNSIHSLAQQYSGKMKILTGYECEYILQLQDEMDELKSEAEIIILGQHFTIRENGEYESIHKRGFVPGDRGLDFFAHCLEEACETKFTNIIAHPDVFMIHKDAFGKKEEEISHRICQAAEKNNIPVEINLCVLAKDMFFQNCDITYPRKEFWEIASRYNLKTIFGLDFHGHFNPSEQQRIIDRVCSIIGEKTIAKLNFCHTPEEVLGS